MWLFAAIPMLICATVCATTAIVRKAPLRPGVAHHRRARRGAELARGAAHPGHRRPPLGRKLERPELFADADWEPVLSELRDDVVDRGHVPVVAPDGDADFIWTESGAQPFSLWLPGSIKLGFDPKAETGLSYLERVRRSEAAFHEGLPGLCRLARDRRRRDRAPPRRARSSGTCDVRPSARYRNRARSTAPRASLHANVAPFIVYDDRNPSEVLIVFPGATLPLGFRSDAAQVRRRAARADVPRRVRVAEPHPHASPTARVIQPDARRSSAATRIRLRYRTPNGVPEGASINAQDRTSIARIIGYEDVPGFHAHRIGPGDREPGRRCAPRLSRSVKRRPMHLVEPPARAFPHQLQVRALGERSRSS